MSHKLTKSAIDAFVFEGATPAQWDVRWDDEVKGFGVRVYASGRKAFILRYANHGRKKTMVIGRYGEITVQQARDLAKRAKYGLSHGVDPLAEKKRRDVAGVTVQELGSRYLAEHARTKKKASSADEDQRILERYIYPALGSKLVSGVEGSDIRRLHHQGRETPYQANRVLSLLSKMFNLAEGWGLRPQVSNPCRGVEKYKEAKRERYLTLRELSRLGAALDEVENDRTVQPQAVAAIKLLLLTGARLSEITGARWEWVDLERRVLALPESKTGAKPVFLNEAAVTVLEQIKASDLVPASPWIIPGRNPERHLINLRKPWTRITEKAGLQHVRLHDLRHTAASMAVAQGMNLPIIGRLLGHRNASTTHRYAHVDTDPALLAANQLGESIAVALGLANHREDAEDSSR